MAGVWGRDGEWRGARSSLRRERSTKNPFVFFSSRARASTPPIPSPSHPLPPSFPQGSADQWRWTLNWDEIDDHIVVGSCPRTPADVAALAGPAGPRPTAILCLQSDLCWDALSIDGSAVVAASRGAGILHARVAVRDFDHADQALMLPEAVRLLATLVAAGHRVYVHCTAGINRATLTVVGYYTFVRGAPLGAALKRVRGARPQAHPYVDCWRTVRGRLLEGRGEEVAARARAIYQARASSSSGSDAETAAASIFPSSPSIPAAILSWGSYDSDGGGAVDDQSAADWSAAETALIREGFTRSVECNLSLLASLEAVEAGRREAALTAAAAAAAAEAGRVAGEEAALARAEARAVAGAGGAGPSLATELEAARAEVAALRVAVQDVLAAAVEA